MIGIGSQRYRIKPRLGARLNGSVYAKGLVVRWLMNEAGGGTLYNIAGSSYDGVVNGPTWDVNGLDFDGVSDYVSMPAWNPSELTLSLWINADDYGSHENGLGRLVDHSWIFCLNSDFPGLGTNNLLFYDGDEWESSNNNVIVLGQWHHVLVTVNATTVAFYVDGLPAGSDVGTHTLYTYGADIHLGKQAGPALYFNGRMNNIAMYNRFLSSAEVLALYRDPYADIQAPVDIPFGEVAVAAVGQPTMRRWSNIPHMPTGRPQIGHVGRF